MTVLMLLAALYGVLQISLLSLPTRSVRLSTVLLAVLVGAYVCGTVTGLVELAYTRALADQPGRSLVEVVNTTAYTTAPWVEELVKVSPLLAAGLYVKVRRQWGLTDFTVLGAGLGAGFGLLEGVLRYALDGDRVLAREGGWIVPDSLAPPYIPGVTRILTSWLPAPVASLGLGQAGDITVATFTHLVWTAVAGLGVGILYRAPGWLKPVSLVLVGAAGAHHALNNYVAGHPTANERERWLESIEGRLWAVPLVALLLAVSVDAVVLHRGKRRLPDVLLGAERSDGDSAAALIRYAAWRPPWTPLIALRFLRLRRALYYSTARTALPPDDPLRRTVSALAARIDATDSAEAWRAADLGARVRAAVRARMRGGRWLLPLIPLILMAPAVLFLCVGSFKSTAGIQENFTSGSGPAVLRGFTVAALVWIAWLLTVFLRTWRQTAAQPFAEVLAAHRLRTSIALASATTGALLLHRSTGRTGPDGPAIPPAHLLEALDRFLLYLGFALLLLSLLALFPPGGGLAVVGVRVVGGLLTREAVLQATALGLAGVALMAAGAGAEGGDSTAPRDVHDALRRGERDVDDEYVWKNGELLFDESTGNLVKILDRQDGTYDVVIKDPSNPSGKPITRFNAPESYVQARLDSGVWQ
ncbi:PrsW family glutamic-type intramembrane protease [Streptomyces sp. B93]|uniref:PrsW family glutamic-type intramembrane protease n=1 Tax=Streptomyces sp. B93 TaxID=2824875 RepID=UPI001B398F9B|nr:PrsW family glutamic-type intramembrane protease [Streptomyces sp. B93]MBQ1094076.1 PrsW family intramembrane metalloprotease [Streptomyces sp. B93]